VDAEQVKEKRKYEVKAKEQESYLYYQCMGRAEESISTNRIRIK